MTSEPNDKSSSSSSSAGPKGFSKGGPLGEQGGTKGATCLKGRVIVALILAIGYLSLSLARRLGAVIGGLCWLVQERGARTTKANIEICFPDLSPGEQKKLAKQSMIETGMLAAEICVIRGRDEAWLDSKIKNIRGEQRVKELIAQGKGLILLAPHLGNWEVLSLYLPRLAPLTALYQPPKQAYLEKLIKDAREKTGATLVPTNRKGVVKLLASLKAGGITAVLPDQNPIEGSGEFSPFYDEPAYTMTLVHGFIKRTECPLIMSFAKRVPGGFEIIFLEPPEGIYSEDPATSLAAMNKAVEQCISYCPAQYQWEYKRFKASEPGGRRYYQD